MYWARGHTKKYPGLGDRMMSSVRERVCQVERKLHVSDQCSEAVLDIYK